jgi:hypothetical protein
MKSLNGMVSSHRWNLIGELFVLEYLQNAFEAEKMIEAFHTSKKYLLFLYQSIEDYADVDKYADLFSDGLQALLKESLIRRIPELYAGLLVNLSAVQMYPAGLAHLGFLYYSQHDYEQAEKRFAQAHQLHCTNGSTNLCYMIRRRETKTHSLGEFKEIMLSVWEDKDAFAVTNMALYLAEYEDDWQGADDLISSLAETEDFSGGIDWWSHLDELEGLLVMTWLERNKICDPCYILEGENILKSLCKKYPGIPDWMIEIRREE